MSIPKDPRVGESLSYVDEGMRVWAPVTESRWRTATVICAQGNSARVRFDRRGDIPAFSAWRWVSELHAFVPLEKQLDKPSPRELGS